VMKLKALLLGGAVALGLMSSPAAAWTGCGVSLGASAMVGSLDFGAPIDISSSGQRADVGLSCDMRMGTSPLIIGAFARYGHFFGDLETIGLEHQVSLGARAGVLASESALIYGHAAWTRTQVTGLDGINGLTIGPGVEVRLAGSPLYLSLEYGYGIPDVSEFTSADVRTHEFAARLTWKFYQTKTVAFTNESDPAPRARDPKLK
jgi:hypothetical protein